jgi:hypothetical protein
MARKTTDKNTQTTEATEPQVDLLKELLAQLKAEGIKPTLRWSPTNKYASLLVEGMSIGQVFAQTSSGIKVKAAVTLKELGRSAGSWRDNSHESNPYTAMGFFARPTEVKRATAALKLAAAKQAKARAAKAGTSA